jgi:potassium-transporting ATPase KdpC subunit
MIRDIVLSIRSVIALWLLTAVFYPLLIWGVGQTMFPLQANGSLITNAQNQVIGSALIGQSFSSDRYFWGRPSVINYSEGEDAATTGLSGASNLAPSNPALLERVQADAAKLQQANIQPTADLLYSSGSGLDPHITPEAAIAQAERVAIARNLPPDPVQQLIAEHIEGRLLGVFGEPVVNVLQLNLALDQLGQ